MAEFVCGFCLFVLLGTLETKLSKNDAAPVDEQTFERAVEIKKLEWERLAAQNGG